MKLLKKAILAIKQIEVNVLLFGGIGVICINLGGLLLYQSPPNFQVGYPTLAIGFACFVFAVAINNSNESTKKTNQILTKLNEIHEELKKRNG